MHLTLTVTAGPHLGQSFTFAAHDLFMVGRSKRSHFQLPNKDRYFSRAHFLVETNPPLCRLQDMGSRNGTFVNGQRVRRADLSDGDEIKAGHTILRVTLAPEVEEAAPATARQPLPAATALPAGPVLAMLPLPTQVQPLPERLTEAATVPPAPIPPAREGPALPGYRVVRLLGRGGMGMVFLAERVTDGMKVAVKTIVPALAGNDPQVQRFLREAEILKQLEHPSIVRFFEVGAVNDILYFVMEYVHGTDFGKLLAKRGPLAVAVAVRVVCQVLEALAHAHARRFVHRDIKPSNVLLGGEGRKRQVKLADFGLARVYQASKLSGLTMTGEAGGTPAYMPPEQITHYRDVSPAADQYSTAAMLYELLTGKCILDLPPWPGSLIAILEQEPVPIQSRRSNIPDGLAAAIHCALAKQPEDRFSDTREFRQAIQPYAAAEADQKQGPPIT